MTVEQLALRSEVEGSAANRRQALVVKGMRGRVITGSSENRKGVWKVRDEHLLVTSPPDCQGDLSNKCSKLSGIFLSTIQEKGGARVSSPDSALEVPGERIYELQCLQSLPRHLLAS